MEQIIYAIGVLAAVIGAIKALSFISIYILPSRFGRYAHASSNGDSPWGLVTGASDGIGRAFAEELAIRGFNVVLHGRNHAKLSLVMSQLQRGYPKRSFRVLVADASNVPCMGCIHQPGDASLDFAAIQSAVSDLHLTVLVNNAGGGSSNPRFAPLSECSAARVTSNISLNALFPLHLTRTLLPQLARSAPALVLNISSMADQGFPLLTSYSSSKQFLMNMTRSVGLEMMLEGKAGQVESLGVRVGRVTGVSALKEKPSFFTPDSQTMARAALDRTGYGHGVVVGYWSHALQQLSTNLLPSWLGDRIVVAVMRKQREEAQKSELKQA